MMRSMNSAVSGLRSHQTYLDVVGNNIANVNTVGYRAGRVDFQDMMSQTLRQATGPSATLGGINPLQVGLGVVVAGVDTINTPGSLESTGRLTDMALQGDGYFILGDGQQSHYTRDGAFDFGADGSLVSSSTGMRVMGWLATDGTIDTTQPVALLNLPFGRSMVAQASSMLKATGNLDSGTAADGTFSVDTAFRDSLGTSHTLKITYTKDVGTNTWDWQVTSPEGLAVTPAALTVMTFDANGAAVPTVPPPTISVTLANGATTPAKLTLDLSGLTQLAAASQVQASSDGSGAGAMTTLNVDSAGIITGVYTNGAQEILGQIAIATFANPSGMLKLGGNLLDASSDSGQPQVGPAGTGGRGLVASGYLEGSNVDLSQQFTNMIMAERGFQANARVISTSNDMLADLVNIIR